MWAAGVCWAHMRARAGPHTCVRGGRAHLVVVRVVDEGRHEQRVQGMHECVGRVIDENHPPQRARARARARSSSGGSVDGELRRLCRCRASGRSVICRGTVRPRRVRRCARSGGDPEVFGARGARVAVEPQRQPPLREISGLRERLDAAMSGV